MSQQIKITLRNPLDKTDKISYWILLDNCQLAVDWKHALKEILDKKLHLEKNYCFLGFPYNSRDINLLCEQLNKHINIINLFATANGWRNAGLKHILIPEYFCEETIRYPADTEYGLARYWIKHDIFNRLHNYFEILQGTVWNLSDYYKISPPTVRYAIRQLNNICHELESLILSQRKLLVDPEWVRPSQITTFLNAPRYTLTDEHRSGFLENRYDRVLGGVYMHWTQIGKTLYEVFRDENAPRLNIGDNPADITLNTGATCEAITALKYYSGEFDIEWAKDVVSNADNPWHDDDLLKFKQWLQDNGLSFDDIQLSLGYLKIGQVDLIKSFGTDNPGEIWQILGKYLDIYTIEVDDTIGTFDYCWNDPDNEQKQIEHLTRNEK